MDKGEAMPLPMDQLRGLNPFAVEYRYDDELIPQTSREALAEILTVVMNWAEGRVSA